MSAQGEAEPCGWRLGGLVLPPPGLEADGGGVATGMGFECRWTQVTDPPPSRTRFMISDSLPNLSIPWCFHLESKNTNTYITELF